MRLNRMNALAACCHFSIFIGSFLYQRAKPPQGIVLFINLLGKGLTPRACMGDPGSIWWVPVRDPFLESPENFLGPKLRPADLFTCCEANKNKNNCNVSCPETPSFWEYKENYVTRNAAETFRDFRETGPSPLSPFVVNECHITEIRQFTPVGLKWFMLIQSLSILLFCCWCFFVVFFSGDFKRSS